MTDLDDDLVEVAMFIGWLRLRQLRARAHDGDDGGHHAEDNTYGLPDGEPIADELRDWLAKQERAVLDAIPNTGLPGAFPDLTADDWVDPMAKAMTPLLASYWDKSGKQVYARLGLDADEWRVVNPHLAAAIRQQALAFSQTTNGSTNKTLAQALTQLRQELVIGMVEEGESIRELAARVQYVFERLSNSHARMIAATEASRAVHAAQDLADHESEVVAGLELLLSSDACPLCRKIATECKRVQLGQSFATIGNNPHYRNVKYPPLHPHCQCTMIEVLKPEYGGPVDPEWGKTLDQPQKGLGDKYTPPAGKPVPKPEPDRPKPRPTKPPPKAPVMPTPPPPAPAPAPVPPPAPGPPPKTPIDEAVDYARARQVKVDRHGAAFITSQVGAVHAARVPAAYEAAGERILINETHDYWRDPAGWMLAANRKQPPWFSTSEPNHIIVHEVGHAKHHANLGDAQYKLVGTGTFSAAEKAFVAQHVSRYAAQEPAEFVAEMYAGLAAGKSYNAEVTRLYLAYGGPLP